MDSTILVSIIVSVCSMVGTLIGSFAGIKQSNKLVNYRIDRLEEMVTKHNTLVERMVMVEQSTKSAHKRLDAITNNTEERK